MLLRAPVGGRPRLMRWAAGQRGRLYSGARDPADRVFAAQLVVRARVDQAQPAASRMITVSTLSAARPSGQGAGQHVTRYGGGGQPASGRPGQPVRTGDHRPASHDRDGDDPEIPDPTSRSGPRVPGRSTTWITASAASAGTAVARVIMSVLVSGADCDRPIRSSIRVPHLLDRVGRPRRRRTSVIRGREGSPSSAALPSDGRSKSPVSRGAFRGGQVRTRRPGRRVAGRPGGRSWCAARRRCG